LRGGSLNDTETHLLAYCYPRLPCLSCYLNVRMASKTRYNLEDFVDYAERHFPDQWDEFCDSTLFVVEYKSFKDKENHLQRRRMVLVGRRFYPGGKQSVWAYATGSKIIYCHGHPNEELVQLVEDLLDNRVYWIEPLTFVANTQSMKSMTKARLIGRGLVELAINVLSLHLGDVTVVSNIGGTDILSDFKFLCLNLGPNREAQEEKKRVFDEQYQANEQEQAGYWS
jgi:hypothetical protein